MRESKPIPRSRRAFLGRLVGGLGVLALAGRLPGAALPQGKGSHFKVSPNPPRHDQDCTVTYTGPETTVYFQVDGGKTIKVTPKKDKDGKKTFKIDKRHLQRGTYLFLTTKKGWPGFLLQEILR